MAAEKLKIDYKTKNNQTNPQTKNHKESHELRQQAQHKSPEHMYLKFITPLTPFVGKIVLSSAWV